MARFSESELSQIKSIPLTDRLKAEGLSLKKQGKDYVTHCVFHNDKTPSLVISPDNNLYHCFGCGVGGSIIDWVMHRQSISFRHAVEWLKENHHNQPNRPADNPIDSTLKNPIELNRNDQQILTNVIDYYHQTLKSEPKALDYLKKRGLNDPILIDHFKLGYANRTLGIRLPLKNRKAGKQIREQLQTIGLYRSTGREHFNGSLVVPIITHHQIQQVYGRKISNGLRAGTPKHIYLPKPQSGVFNLDGFTGQHRTGEIILCESLIDALTCWQYGQHQVTTSYGVNGFTNEIQQALIDNQIQTVYIAYDNDESGNKASETVKLKLSELGMHCYRVQLPIGEDINSYVCSLANPQQGLSALLQNAKVVSTDEGQTGELLSLVAHVDVANTVNYPCTDVQIINNTDKDQQHLTIGNRHYRIRGLANNLTDDSLKIQLMVSIADEPVLNSVNTINPDSMHSDKLDLYSHKQRQIFINQASQELVISPDCIKADLSKLMLTLEQHQQEIKHTEEEDKQAPKAISDQDKKQALNLLKSPNLLKTILDDFTKAGIVGEDSNKLIGYIASVSRLLPKPLALMIQSSSASGKSALMDSILALIPEEHKIQYSAMTGQSLFYMGDNNLQHKILAISEEEGVQHASYALKLLQSEGEVSIASTGKDDNTGKLITHEYTVKGPVMLMMTTTAIDIDEELLNRCLVLSVNESRQQTKAIHQAQRDKRTLAGLTARLDKNTAIDKHQNAQRLLRSLVVVNPYAHQLTFVDDKTRTRRDHDKYLTLIDSIALLHQYQRQIKSIEHNGQQIDYIEVTTADIDTANHLASEVLGKTLDELPPQTRKLLSHIQKAVTEECEQKQLKQAQFRFNRRWVREQIGWSEKQVRQHIHRLQQMEYVLTHKGGRGQCFEYELLYTGQGQQGQTFMMGLIETDKLTSVA